MTNPIRNLAPELFAKLSPPKMHESNWFMSLLCNFGLHRWYRLNLGAAIPAIDVSLCRCRPKVKVHGLLYGD
jgi:hypothetical protein